MSIGWHRLAIIAALCASALVLGLSGPAAARAPSHGVDRQILVMVRLAPPHLRPHHDYGSGYGDDPGQAARKGQAKRIARKLGLTLVDNWPMPLVAVDCFVMEVPDGRSVDEAAAAAAREPGIAWAQPVQTFRTQGAIPSYDDPLFLAQPAAVQWHLPEIHQIATGRGIRVAVVDSGIDAAHPDLKGQIAVARNFAPDDAVAPDAHGTEVAGIIAAVANNHIGMVGVAPQSRLMALRACEQAGRSSAARCDSLSLAKALLFAIEHRADVINLSLSGPPDPLLAKLLQAGLDRGVLFVAAYDLALPDGGFPASFRGVVAVSDGALPTPKPGVYVAPGRDVPTTMPGGRWQLVSGSSFAAAHVSGLFALLRDRRPRATASNLVSAKGGGGTIDACATLVRAVTPCDCACAAIAVAAKAAR